MNRAIFSLPPEVSYQTARGLKVSRVTAHFSGGTALDNLIDLLDRRRGVVLSSGTTVPGRYESFDFGFADPPLRLESTGYNFFIEALNVRGKVLIAFLSDGITLEPGDVIATGTPSGVGAFRKPPVWLADGDEVVVEIERIGRLVNRFRTEQAS